MVIWAAFAIGGTPEGRDREASLLDVATASGVNFSLAAVFVSGGFLMTVPVALFFGDTVASEADWSSLRYLLTAPVSRARLLFGKSAVALAFSAAAVVLLPVVALGVGTVAYGWGDLQLATAGSLPADTALRRLARDRGVRLRQPTGGRRIRLLALHGHGRPAWRGRRRGRGDDPVQHPGLHHGAGISA